MRVRVKRLECEGRFRFGPRFSLVGEGIAASESRVGGSRSTVPLNEPLVDADLPFGFGRMRVTPNVESEQRFSLAVHTDTVGIGVALVGHVDDRMTVGK